MTAHWDIPDPAAAQGTSEEIDRAYSQAFQALDRRISLFLSTCRSLRLTAPHIQKKRRSDKKESKRSSKTVEKGKR